MPDGLGTIARASWMARTFWRRLRHPELAATPMQATLAARHEPVPGRTLPREMQWCGKDNPGGAAARRRLRQQARLRARAALDALRGEEL